MPNHKKWSKNSRALKNDKHDKKITAQMPNWAKNMRILSEIKQKLYNIEEIQETLNEIETFLTK